MTDFRNRVANRVLTALMKDLYNYQERHDIAGKTPVVAAIHRGLARRVKPPYAVGPVIRRDFGNEPAISFSVFHERGDRTLVADIADNCTRLTLHLASSIDKLRIPYTTEINLADPDSLKQIDEWLRARGVKLRGRST